MICAINSNSRLYTYIWSMVLALLINVWCNTAYATSAYTFPAEYTVTISSTNGVGAPPGLECTGESINAVYDCANQIMLFNSGGNNPAGVLQVTSMSPSGLTYWNVEYIPAAHPDTILSGSVGFGITYGCEDGYQSVATPSGVQCEPVGKDDLMCTVGNPISIVSGDKIELETDYQGNGLFPIKFNRYYNSNVDAIPQKLGVASQGSVGARWNHEYSGQLTGDMATWFNYDPDVLGPNLKVHYDENSDLLTVRVTVYRPDGAVYQFTNIYNPYTGCHDFSPWVSREPGAVGTLKDVSSCSGSTDLIYTTEDNISERYSNKGLLKSIEYPSGVKHAITREPGTNRISQISHSTGEELFLDYDPATSRITSIVDKQGRAWSYSHDANGNLQFVTNPDGTVREYHYEKPGLPYALTGITDERGLRYSHYTYKSDSGEAIASYHGPETYVLSDRIEGFL